MDSYKQYIFGKIRPKASLELQKIQKSPMKVKCINFKDLDRPQNYLGHKLFSNKLSSLIFDLRCRNVRSIKENFHKQFKGELLCPLRCMGEIDSQNICQYLLLKIRHRLLDDDQQHCSRPTTAVIGDQVTNITSLCVICDRK